MVHLFIEYLHFGNFRSLNFNKIRIYDWGFLFIACFEFANIYLNWPRGRHRGYCTHGARGYCTRRARGISIKFEFTIGDFFLLNFQICETFI